MQSLLTDQMRLLALVGICGLLWSLESIVPLYRYQNSRVRHALPNVALTLILVLTNLALSFFSAYLAAFSARNGVGLFFLFGRSTWTQVVLGVVALDLFAYLAHVLLHKSWLGWQFHRVHHSENAL
jgi:sterol desaturase/sphingolipid hydroxylase (fatty acid hydroxylase superfamily)